MNTENTYTYIHTRRNHHMGCEIAFAESRSETVSLLEVGQEEKIHRLSWENNEEKEDTVVSSQ